MKSALANIVMAVGLGAGAALADGVAAPAASGSPSSMTAGARVLVIGDSTAAGTGAPPSMSVAARLARAFPETQVDNRGEDGALLADVRRQLERDMGRQPALLLVMAGGNDIFRLSSVSTMDTELDALLDLAKARAEHVVLLTPGNLATAPALWWPFDRFLGWRSSLARETFDRVAQRHGVRHVSMFRAPAEDPFALEPARNYADDGIHPSAEGYALWYDALRRNVPLGEWLHR